MHLNLNFRISYSGPVAAFAETLWNPPPMTRCECAEMRFEEIKERLAADRTLCLDELGKRTGCGQTCTACIPDLKAFLARTR
jgi:bacterioferritin-associated ferredoxin